MLAYFFNRPLPPGLEGLADLALDLRWTWSHFSDRLWETAGPRCMGASPETPTLSCRVCRKLGLEEAAKDAGFKEELQKWLAERQRYLQRPRLVWTGTSERAG